MEGKEVKRSLCSGENEEVEEKKMKMSEDLPDVSAEENVETNLSEQLNLLDLNNDCLYVILSYLKTDDLTNVANTCVRLQDCAIYVFKHYRKGSIRFDSGSKIYDWDYLRQTNNLDSYSFTKVREAVRIFGPHAKDMTINVTVFNELFSPDSALSTINHYCKSLDTMTLNELKFTKWVPPKEIDYLRIVDPDSDDSFRCDSDEDREWKKGEVSLKFFDHLPKVKNVIINKAIMFCGSRMFDFWDKHIESISFNDVLVGDGFLQSFRKRYDEVKFICRNERRHGRGDTTHNNFRIVEALFTPKCKAGSSSKIE